MKKLLIFFTLFTLFLSIPVQLYADEETETGYAKSDSYLLKEMYNESQHVTSLVMHQKLEILEHIGGTWYKVRAGIHVGYIPVSGVIIREKIPYVSVHVDDPAPGNVPFLTAVVHGDGYENYITDPLTWTDKTTGKSMKSGDMFIEGHSYSVSIWLSALFEYEFDTYDGEPSVQATINGHLATVNKAYEQDPERVIELYYDYGKLESVHQCRPQYVAQVDSTCISTGHESYYHCECGLNYKDSKGQNPFEFGDWGVLPAIDHTIGDWKYNGTHHYRKCTQCFSVIAGTNAPHSGGKATCTELAKCSTCGFEYGEYDDHKYEKEWPAFAEEGHVHLCSNKDCPAHTAIEKHKLDLKRLKANLRFV